MCLSPYQLRAGMGSPCPCLPTLTHRRGGQPPASLSLFHITTLLARRLANTRVNRYASYYVYNVATDPKNYASIIYVSLHTGRG